MYLSYSLVLLAAFHTSHAAPIRTENPIAFALRWFQDSAETVSLIHRRAPSPLPVTFENPDGSPIATLDQTAASSSVLATISSAAGTQAAASTGSTGGGVVGIVPAVGYNPGQGQRITSFPSVAQPTQGPSAPSAVTSAAANDGTDPQGGETTVLTTRMITVTKHKHSRSRHSRGSQTFVFPSASAAPAAAAPQQISSVAAAAPAVPAVATTSSAAPVVTTSVAPTTTTQPSLSSSPTSSTPTNADTFPLVAPASSQVASSAAQSRGPAASQPTYTVSVVSASASAQASGLAIPVPTVFTITPSAIVTTLTIAPPDASTLKMASSADAAGSSPIGLSIVPISKAPAADVSQATSSASGDAVTVTATVVEAQKTVTVTDYTATVTTSVTA